MVRVCPRSATLSPRQAAGSAAAELRTVSAQANCVGPSTPPVYDSLTPRRAAGPGAHSVGQGPTVTAAPTPGRSLSPAHSVAHSLPPTVSAKG